MRRARGRAVPRRELRIRSRSEHEIAVGGLCPPAPGRQRNEEDRTQLDLVVVREALDETARELPPNDPGAPVGSAGAERNDRENLAGARGRSPPTCAHRKRMRAKRRGPSCIRSSPLVGTRVSSVARSRSTRTAPCSTSVRAARLLFSRPA